MARMLRDEALAIARLAWPNLLAGGRPMPFAGLALGPVAYGVNNMFAVLYVSRIPRVVAREA